MSMTRGYCKITPTGLKVMMSPGPDKAVIQYKLYDSLDLTPKKKSFQVRTFVFFWVLSSLADISTITPNPDPERITKTLLNQISLVSHAGVHHGRCMGGLFAKQKVGDTVMSACSYRYYGNI